jgi:hypothetical protein
LTGHWKKKPRVAAPVKNVPAGGNGIWATAELARLTAAKVKNAKRMGISKDRELRFAAHCERRMPPPYDDVPPPH